MPGKYDTKGSKNKTAMVESREGSGTPGKKPTQTGGVNLYTTKRRCECLNPLPYRDDDAVMCYRCGHKV